MRHQRLLTQIIILLSSTAFPASLVYGWGSHGHEIIAKLAEERLSAKAKSEITRFLGSTDLASVANWADTVKYTTMPETYDWHFVNIPKSEIKFDAERDCLEVRRGYCAIAALDTLSSTLQDATPSFAEKVAAIKFLVHIVGDISQPFHCIDNDDHGGNEVSVEFLGKKIYMVSDWQRPYNLHDVWDDALVDYPGISIDAHVKKLDSWLKRQNIKKLTKLSKALNNSSIAWVEESHAIGIQQYVNPGTNLDQTYIDQAEPIADQQLALAGIRLAALLNRVFAHERRE